MSRQQQDSPVSFPVDVRRLPEKGFPVRVEADEAQRQALAVAHGLLSVSAFRAELVVRNWKRDGFSVRGKVGASILQACVVTLDPVAAEIDEEIDALFVPPSSPLARPDLEEGEMFLSADGPDAPEILDGHTIDVGALAEELFALGIDPYPRSTGADVLQPKDEPDGDSPFAGLAGRIAKD